MKYFYIFALFFCLLSLGNGAPVTRGPGDDKGSDPPRKDKGKGRAVDPPSRSPSRPNTPTPEHDPSIPLPGRSGVHTGTNIVTMYYGDDNLPEHMGHLQRNQAEFPHNRNPMSLSTNPGRNRRNALHKVPTAAPHPVSKNVRHRDEKMPAMLDNPHHATSTTVEHLPEKESNREGGMLSTFNREMEKTGKKGQLRPNPGWLPLHPNQQRGHEAPARLSTQVQHPQSDAPGNKAQKGAGSSQAKADRGRAGGAKEGYTPIAGQKTLCKRPGKSPPPPPAPPRKKGPAQGGRNNLQPGHVLPAGHVWKPSSDGSKTPSHVGAPGHLKGAEQRYPPRPQNHKSYIKQLHAHRDEEAKHKKAASKPPKAPTQGASKPPPEQSDNHRKFNEKFGPAKPGNGAGRAHEAPARMQTHPQSPHTAPPKKSSSPPPSSRPPTKESHSKKPGSSKRK